MRDKQLISGLLGFAAIIIMLVPRCAIAAQDIGNTKVKVVLDLPYGTGFGAVGKKITQHFPPLCPAMFQMMPDGTIWVLDTVNSRVLAFKNGRQIRRISTAKHRLGPRIFGVTGNSVFVQSYGKPSNGPVFLLLDYDAKSGALRRSIRMKIRNGVQLDPLEIQPLGGSPAKLLISGSPSPSYAAEFTSAIYNDKGVIERVIPRDGLISMADGGIAKFEITDQSYPNVLPFTVSKYDIKTGGWKNIIDGVIPRREDLYAQRHEITYDALGIDRYGRLALVLYEGRPPCSPIFMWITPSGEVLRSATLEDLGWDSSTLSMFESDHFQLASNGDILIQYTDQKRYRILSINP